MSEFVPYNQQQDEFNSEITPLPDEPDREDTESADIRAQILSQFERWLDAALQQGDAEGIAEEVFAMLEDSSEADEQDVGADLYSLWSAVTRLAQETKLQGRAFGQLRQTLSPMEDLTDSTASTLEQLKQLLEQTEESRLDSARQQVQSHIADLLIELRERVLRGLDVSKDYIKRNDSKKKNFLKRLFRIGGREIEAVRGLVRGYIMTFERIEEILHEFGISEIQCMGGPFDPQMMKAVDVEETADIAEGTVVGVYRRGYKLYDRIHRCSEVKVSRHPDSFEFADEING